MDRQHIIMELNIAIGWAQITIWRYPPAENTSPGRIEPGVRISASFQIFSRERESLGRYPQLVIEWIHPFNHLSAEVGLIL